MSQYQVIDRNPLFDAQAQQDIAAAFERFGFGNPGGAVESLGLCYPHGQLRVFREAAQTARNVEL